MTVRSLSNYFAIPADNARKVRIKGKVIENCNGKRGTRILNYQMINIYMCNCMYTI